MSNEKTTKMEFLKRKSRRKNLLQELSYLTFTEEPFLDVKHNDRFCKKVFSMLNTKKNKIKLQEDDYKENIQKSIDLLNGTIHTIRVTPKRGRLLFFREDEIEAVLINMNEVFSNLHMILESTKFSTGYGDFILLAEDFSFGLCIERTEYFYEFSTWGLS